MCRDVEERSERTLSKVNVAFVDRPLKSFWREFSETYDTGSSGIQEGVFYGHGFALQQAWQ